MTHSTARTPLESRASGPLSGKVRVPGDKSISHRALIFGALSVGKTTISGLLEGEDVLNTAKSMRALGAKVERTGPFAWQVSGRRRGGLRPARRPARFRQFRHRLPAGDGGGRGLSDHGRVRRRRLAAHAPDAPDPRSAGTDGCQGRRGEGRRPPAADAARRARSRADPLPDPGRLGPDQVGGAAGGARRARRHHRDRAGSQPRPHRTDAETFRRRDRLGRTKAATAARSRSPASPNCMAPTSWCPPIRPRRRSRSWRR